MRLIMRRELTSLLYAPALAATLTGCGRSQLGTLTTESNFHREVTPLSTPEIKGSQPRKVANHDYALNLEQVVLNDNRMYVMPNPSDSQNELPIMFILDQDASLVLPTPSANQAKKPSKQVQPLGITSERFYVPEIYTYEDATGKERMATEITLATRGPHAVSAQRTPFNTKGVDTGVIQTTQNDLRYTIKTMYVAGKEYFVPRVETSNLNGNMLNFYMMPVEGTETIINADGQITLRNQNGLYNVMLETIFTHAAPGQTRPLNAEVTSQAISVK